MIIQSLCNSCFQPYTIIVQPKEVHLLHQVADKEGHTAPCPRLCGGSINLIGNQVIEQMAGDRRLKEPMTLTVKELYQAIGGMGLPDEIPKDPVVTSALLKAHRVLRADIEDVNGKLYLHELELESGVTIHLSSGARGAQILKITKEKTDEVGTAPHS